MVSGDLSFLCWPCSRFGLANKARREVFVCSRKKDEAQKRWENLARETGNVAKLFRSRKTTKAFEKLDRMMDSGQCPDLVLFNRLLRVCAVTKSKEAGERLFTIMEEARVPPDGRSYAELVMLYQRRRNFKAIELLTKKMEENRVRRTVEFYNSLILTCLATKDKGKAENLMNEMSKDGIKPGLQTYVILAKLFTLVGDHAAVESVFRHALRSGINPSDSLLSRVIQGLCAGGSLDKAEMVLTRMLDTGRVPDTDAVKALTREYVKLGDFENLERMLFIEGRKGEYAEVEIYDACFAGFCEWKRFEDSRRFRRRMKMDGIPANSSIARSLLKLCAYETGSAEAVDLLLGELVIEGVRKDGKLYDGLVVAQSHCGDLEGVQKSMKQMTVDDVTPNFAVYSSAIVAFAKEKRTADVRAMLRWSRRDSVWPSAEACRMSLVLFVEEGCIEDLRSLLENMKSRKEALDPVVVGEVVAVFQARGLDSEAAEIRDAFLVESAPT
uniref:Pentacotripeptide-repeat region of PRORP domain-containing protein n=1 Tax=Rhodosorus marinus TaxID=101924 RepID=A0A7S2ZEC3_9RHOD|mmetsp:Transcript_16584/g.68045  ORF Transcript_16584/g.68045 Transcript_16584/m.68045 type:complete len:498 (+) Transcript_16584:455-1948(+)